MIKISVILLNWNQFKLTIDCLKSVLKSKLGNKINLKIIVVDNGSKGKDVKKINSFIKSSGSKGKIKLIKNKENLGFTGGNNIGIRYALKDKADFVFILNNDTEIKDDCILELWKAFSKNGNIGIVSPKIYYYPGFEFHKNRYRKNDLGRVIWYAGGKIDWNNILGQHIGIDKVDKGQFNRIGQVELATGCAMLVKKEVFKKIGLLDERFFIYLEDLDFSYRARRKGFKLLFWPQAMMYHKNAGSTGSGSPFQNYYFTRSRLLFARKHASFKMRLLLFKEALKGLMGSDKIKKEAVKDFFLKRFGYKNIDTIE